MNMDIEAQAREFLAAEYERAGLDRAADRCRNGDLSAYMKEPIAAIIAAIIAALTSVKGNAENVSGADLALCNAILKHQFQDENRSGRLTVDVETLLHEYNTTKPRPVAEGAVDEDDAGGEESNG